jgi:protein-tyrosine phosphatase
MKLKAQTSILFVCMGNICRSPTAEGVMRKLVADAGLEHAFHLDSAGTHGYHIGSPPDDRSVMFAARRGVDLTPLRARQVGAEDFERFHLILAMDHANLQWLRHQSPKEHHPKLRLLMSFATQHGSPIVPDPYYGGDRGFEEVLSYCEDACKGILSEYSI